MITTSEQAYEEYQRLQKVEEKLSRGNSGLNLLNSSKFKPNYFISIKKVGKRTLIDSRDWLVVNTNLPFSDWRYNFGEVGVEEFLKELEEWVSIPKFDFFLCHNRKRDNKVSFWELPSFRKHKIEVSEIEFRIGKEAEHEIKLQGYDIVGTIKDLILKQREPTPKESSDFEKFKLLLEKKDDLKRQRKPKSDYGYYSYDKPKDDSIPFILDDESYNSKLKIIEKEMKKLCNKYSFFKLPDFNYIEIKEEISFDDWFKENEEELRETWDSEIEKEDYDGDFNSYVEDCFSNVLEDEE
ncbi:hypothetical protein LCGC14_2256760 [marine sediment metagenome]|uniref:Uncharacterized protein n=1 Tax=marine sediment metagenome TaxID=412755 RepID=A0A0F9FW03_9ZZZZ